MRQKVFKKKASGRPPEYTLFYAGDIHGSEKCFRKFVNAAKFYSVDALILGGDISGKALVPLVEHDDGTVRAHFLGADHVLREVEEVETLKQAIRFNGFYPFEIREMALRELASDNESRQSYFDGIMADELRRWVNLADERLGDQGTRCLIMPGNDDETFTGAVLDEAEYVVNPDLRVTDMGPFQVLSVGYSNVTPWNSPREMSEEQLDEEIRRLEQDLDSTRPLVLNLHVPPLDTGLDLAPKLRDDLSIVGGSNPHMVPVGSRAVRDAITRLQPVLSLHGHIHESRGSVQLGKSVAINPGSEYNSGVLRGVIVRLRQDEVVSVQFVSA
jgi:Icc-related predicted phosphoesterase